MQQVDSNMIVIIHNLIQLEAKQEIITWIAMHTQSDREWEKVKMRTEKRK